MKVKKIMHGITLVDPEKSILETAKVMEEKDIGSVLSKKDGRFWILTERDILKKVVAKNLNPEKIKVSDIMTECLYTLNADDDIEKASELFNKYHIRRLPITKGGEIVGIITTRDIAKGFIYSGLKRKKEEYSGYLR